MNNSLSKNIKTEATTQSNADIPKDFPYIKVGTISITTIIGAILLALFVNSLRNGRQNRKLFVKASEKYRKAFVPIQKALDSSDVSDRDILNSTYDGIIEASIEFKGYLPGKDMSRFEKDIKEYKKHKKERVEVGPFEFFGTEILDANFIEDPDHHKGVEIMRKKQIKKHINTLLSYTSLK